MRMMRLLWSAILAALPLLLAGTAGAQQTRLVSLEAILNTCAELPDVVSDARAEFEATPRTPRLVSQPILDRLSVAGREKIEALFRCFGMKEVRILKRDQDLGVIREIAVHIPLVRVRLAVEPSQDIVEYVVYVGCSVQQKADGTFSVWGSYNSG